MRCDEWEDSYKKPATQQALRMGSNGDSDVIISYHTAGSGNGALMVTLMSSPLSYWRLILIIQYLSPTDAPVSDR